MQWCCLQLHRLNINETAILFYLKKLFFLNILLFYFIPKSQEDNFFNYTDFCVNYDKGRYIPILKIQLIYIKYHNFSTIGCTNYIYSQN